MIPLSQRLSVPHQRRYLTVEFPGFVKENTSKALECFGGEEAVSSLVLPDQDGLPIPKKFNPINANSLPLALSATSEKKKHSGGKKKRKTITDDKPVLQVTEEDQGDIYNPVLFDAEMVQKTQLRCQFGTNINVAENSHALFSDTVIKPSFLWKVNKIVRKKKLVDKTTKKVKYEHDEVVQVEILGKAPFFISFPGFGDFYYLNSSNQNSSCNNGSFSNLDMIPPRFNPYDMPCDYAFQAGEWEKNVHKKEKFLHIPYHYDIPIPWEQSGIPLCPPEGTFAALESTQKHPIPTHLKKMFEERPIWYKYTLIHEFAEIGKSLGYEKRAVIKYLPAVAYRFSSGPWRQFWIRYGYDPRKHPEARFYQLIDYRLTSEQAKALDIKIIDTTIQDIPYRKHLAIHHAKAMPERHKSLRKDVRSSHYSSRQDVDVRTSLIPNIPAHHANLTMAQLQFQDPPSRVVSFFQIYDLKGEDITSAVAEFVPTVVCTKATGWFTQKQLEEIRAIMRSRIQMWISGELIRIQAERKSESEEEISEEENEPEQPKLTLEMMGQHQPISKEAFEKVELDSVEDGMIDSDGSYDEYEILGEM